MKRLLCVLVLASCGAPDDAPVVSLGLSLSAAAAQNLAELQVAFVQQGGVDCERIHATCVKSVVEHPVPVAGAQAGKPAWQVPFTQADGGKVQAIQVDAGTYLVAVEGLDASGKIVANACKLRVELREGSSTDLTLALADYTGPACDAKF